MIIPNLLVEIVAEIPMYMCCYHLSIIDIYQAMDKMVRQPGLSGIGILKEKKSEFKTWSLIQKIYHTVLYTRI